MAHQPVVAAHRGAQGRVAGRSRQHAQEGQRAGIRRAFWLNRIETLEITETSFRPPRVPLLREYLARLKSDGAENQGQAPRIQA